MQEKRHIAILGSTGSIGRQTLEVIAEHPDYFSVEVLTAQNNADLLIEQAIKFRPNAVVIVNEKHYLHVKEALDKYDIKVFTGRQSLLDIVEMSSIDIVLLALVGFSGVEPAYRAIQAKKTIALANKETLVVAGDLIMSLADENRINILPVDSEHSAIFQCLVGEGYNKIDKLTLTASGGPFFGKTTQELIKVTPQQALQHPNWTMGNKVTIDSATLMNKGLEMIEAHWLFNIPSAKMQVIVHPQSIIHSLVHFVDGSLKAQMGLPDMRIPIQYALAFPFRLENNFPHFSFKDYASLTFYEPDKKTFDCLSLAYQAIEKGGNIPCAMNAANEIAVEAFLQEKIGFMDIPLIIKTIMGKVDFVKEATLDNYFQTDKLTRILTKEFIDKLISRR